jgi:hypothetical protein
MYSVSTTRSTLFSSPNFSYLTKIVPRRVFFVGCAYPHTHTVSRQCACLPGTNLCELNCPMILANSIFLNSSAFFWRKLLKRR